MPFSAIEFEENLLNNPVFWVVLVIFVIVVLTILIAGSLCLCKDHTHWRMLQDQQQRQRRFPLQLENQRTIISTGSELTGNEEFRQEFLHPSTASSRSHFLKRVKSRLAVKGSQHKKRPQYFTNMERSATGIAQKKQQQELGSDTELEKSLTSFQSETEIDVEAMILNEVTHRTRRLTPSLLTSNADDDKSSTVKRYLPFSVLDTLKQIRHLSRKRSAESDPFPSSDVNPPVGKQSLLGEHSDTDLSQGLAHADSLPPGKGKLGFNPEMEVTDGAVTRFLSQPLPSLEARLSNIKPRAKKKLLSTPSKKDHLSTELQPNDPSQRSPPNGSTTTGASTFRRYLQDTEIKTGSVVKDGDDDLNTYKHISVLDL